MNIQQLTYIVEIANCKSISRAAEYLFVSQPALSQQIRNLEKELGYRVFHRTSKGLELTEKGNVFYQKAQEMLKDWNRFKEEVIEELEAEVRLHDPYEALDGKEDGLYFYRILAEKVPEYLTDGGWLVMEIGYDQSADVEKLLKETGFEQVSTQKDLAGLDRVVCGVYNRRSK